MQSLRLYLTRKRKVKGSGDDKHQKFKIQLQPF